MRMRPSVTIADLRELTVMPVWKDDPSVPSVGSALGCGRTQAYAEVEAGWFPVIKTNGRIHVPVPAFLRALGYDPAVPDATATDAALTAVDDRPSLKSA